MKENVFSALFFVLLSAFHQKLFVVLWTKAVVHIWIIDITNIEDRGNGLLIVQSKAFFGELFSFGVKNGNS